MHKKKENLFPTFLQLYLRQVLLFFTSYGLGTLNPTVIIGLAMVLLLAFKQYGIELFSIKTKLQLLPDCFFLQLLLLHFLLADRYNFSMSQQTIQRQRLLMEVFFTFLFISPFLCILFYFYNRFIYQCQNWKHFLLLKTHRLSLQENIFYSLLSF